MDMTESDDDKYEDISCYDVDIAGCNLLDNSHYFKFSENFNAIVARVTKLEVAMTSMSKTNSELICKHNSVAD